MTKSNVIPYFMAMSRPMVRGMASRHCQRLRAASGLPPLLLCTGHTSKISYPFPHLNLQFCPLLDPSPWQETQPQPYKPFSPGPFLSSLTSQSYPPQKPLYLAAMPAAGDWHSPQQGIVPSTFPTIVSFRLCDNHILQI